MNQELTPSEIETLAELATDGTEDLPFDELPTQLESNSQTFYGSDYPTAKSTEAKNRAFMAQALQGMSDRERSIVLRTAMETDIKGDDPLFIFLIATGKIELLLHQKPAEIAAHFDKQYQEWQQDWQKRLTLEEAKALEWAMSDVGKSARKNPELVQWVTSSQGQYAKELMEWNQVLLTKQGGKLLCEKDAQKLGVVLRLEGRETKTGFCTLWVRSPERRKYLE